MTFMAAESSPSPRLFLCASASRLFALSSTPAPAPGHRLFGSFTQQVSSVLSEPRLSRVIAVSFSEMSVSALTGSA